MTYLLKFLGFVVILNVVRYVLGFPLERVLIFERLVGAMERSSSCFNVNFSTFDWVTSFFYNFMMWLCCAWVFLAMCPVLRGNYIVKSLKVYALMCLFFLSLSAIYMNHYRHPRDFYLWNMLDAVLVYSIVALANGLIYPRLFRERTGM